ncbi:hypothetical protein EXU85_28745 [Spirosoma sp. KCTC 42546]|uniref:hypothetical protein n=1 Tax=Spirosoma sp. KCTC 42546 TaxID=2520506 RepID=UPI00115C07F6|nr:hypothetical protein [Spirosoma sp. KCTC 42546]QDK82382.1 hypothetical protein EXU85_28745 [Spirosoma sp. KCTC 42546]
MASLLCPSSTAKPGAALFGVQTATGHVEYLDEPIIIDQTFVETARQGRTPEERFRFASPCAKTGCGHWDSGQAGCGLVGKIVEVMNRKAEATLVACAIRDRCRWYHQDGDNACANCDEVVRNIRTQTITD